MIRRALRIGLASLVLLCSVVPAAVSTAQDYSGTIRDLVTGGDFRVRVAAALSLGKAKNSNAARLALENALGDSHPAVRAAAAAALGTAGNTSSFTALKTASSKETTGSVKAQMENTMKRLSAPAAAAAPRARFLVSVGKLQNKSGVNSAMPTFRSTTYSHMAQIPGAEVLAEGADAGTESKSRGLPVLVMDGSLTRLARDTSGSDVRFSAKVEYLIRQVPEQSLKGTVSGAAQALADARSVKSEREVAQLQADAVTAAVESAMKGAPPALEAAAKR
jgi:hypothetical protein